MLLLLPKFVAVEKCLIIVCCLLISTIAITSSYTTVVQENATGTMTKRQFVEDKVRHHRNCRNTATTNNNNNIRDMWCQRDDVARKAYIANTVVVARAESMSRIRHETYTVLFKVVERVKNSTSFPVADYLALKFIATSTNDHQRTDGRTCSLYCDVNMFSVNNNNRLITAKIVKAKEYILFLNAYGAHNYSAIGVPEPKRRKLPNTILRVCNPAFRPKEVRVERLERVQRKFSSSTRSSSSSSSTTYYHSDSGGNNISSRNNNQDQRHYEYPPTPTTTIPTVPNPHNTNNNSRTYNNNTSSSSSSSNSSKYLMYSNTNRLKLVCKVRGFPIPYIIWQRNGTILHPNNAHIRITYNKRRTTLVIKSPTPSEWWGRYQCIAQGVDGSVAVRELRVGNHHHHLHHHHHHSNNNHHVIINNNTNSKNKKKVLHQQSTTTITTGLHCTEEMKSNYCLNGGTCFYEPSMREYACLCAEGYSGNRCVEKKSNQSSMYRQTPLYTCKLGLYTKYDNC